MSTDNDDSIEIFDLNITEEEIRILIDESWQNIDDAQRMIKKELSRIDELKIILSGINFGNSLSTLDGDICDLPKIKPVKNIKQSMGIKRTKSIGSTKHVTHKEGCDQP